MRILVLFFSLFLFSQSLSSQNYLVRFAGSGLSQTVDSVLAVNLSTGDSVTIYGTDTLHLINPSSINQTLYEKDGLAVSPNPAPGECNISFNCGVGGDLQISLFDISGKLVTLFHDKIRPGEHTYCIGGIMSGVYMVAVATPGSKFSGKVVFSSSTGNVPFVSRYSGTPENLIHARIGGAKNSVQMLYDNMHRMLFKAWSGNYGRVRTLYVSYSQTILFEFIECTDGDGNHYPVVTIGTQTWMAENLRTTKYQDGTPLYHITDNSVWSNTQSPAYCWYEHDSAKYALLTGALYNWYAVDSNNLCPVGWHVPSHQEFTTLSNQFGGEPLAGGPLKAIHPTYWYPPNTGATNATGWTGLPGGFRVYNGNFTHFSLWGYWWTSTLVPYTNAWARVLRYNSNELERENWVVRYGYSVRCIKD